MSQPRSETEAAQNATYRVLVLVGQGQFAQVYCAIHRRTGEMVAIKRSRHPPDTASQEPFILQQLNHPNLLRCHSIAQTATGYQFILDYCEGGTLRTLLDTDHPIPFPQTKALITDILLGLATLHDQAVIHGDLKPENILLTYPEQSAPSPPHPLTPSAKIADFGTARFIEYPNPSRREIGSPTYAAPERFDGTSSYASDLYSVGVILYEMLLCDRPFSGSPDTLRQAHQTQEIPFPLALPLNARKLLSTALHKQPKHRFPSATAMLDALQQLSDSPLSTKSDKQAPRLSLSAALHPYPNADVSQPTQTLTPPQISKIRVNTWRSSQLSGGLLTALHTKVIDLLAIDSKHLTKVRTSQEPAKTVLEFFTRKGLYIGQLSFHFPIAEVALTAEPYKLIARTATPASNLVEIILKPFRVIQLPHYSNVQGLATMPWGYILLHRSHLLVLDREFNVVNLLEDLPPSTTKISAMGDRTLLLAHTSPQPNEPQADASSAHGSPCLSRIDLDQLDLGIIF